jgi:flagellin
VNATTAIATINAAIKALGTVQGTVGAGENQLQYSVNLLNSQITNYSSAESAIRDANVAQDAANLTKGQVLQQTAIAAMAQANAEPQAVLKLLQ